MLTKLILPTTFILIWSSGYLVGTIGVHAGSPLALIAWRFLIALTVITIISLTTHAPWPRTPRTYLHLLITGALLQTVQLGCVYLGLGAGVPAGLSSVIMGASPLLVAAAGAPLLREHLRPRQWTGLVIGLAGVIISLSPKLTTGHQPLAGYLYTAIALIGFAAGTLYQKRFGQTVDLRTGTTIQLLGATLTSFPLAALHGGLHLPLTPAALGSLAWLGTINSIGAFIVLFTLLRTRTSGAATSLLYLVPPVTALLAVPLLHQPLTAAVIIGMIVSGIGVTLATTRPTRDTSDYSPPPPDAPDPSPRCSSATSSTSRAPTTP
jgi:drug/metabolite transporter (DMT)-like permease